MKMLIRTEDGGRLVEINAKEFHVERPVDLPYRSPEYALWADDVCLAQYGSHQAAIRQLDDIQEWLEKKPLRSVFGGEPVYDFRTRKVKEVGECTSESTPALPVQAS